MSTAEDVFCLYERNSSYYFDCSKMGKIDECPDCYKNMCYCFLKQNVLPCVIGDHNTQCKLNKKCYIRPGEDCPICYEPILTKTNAYLTECGHAFHKSCMSKCIETKWLCKYDGDFNCPICRHHLGYLEITKRYSSENVLDKLENLWISKENDIPIFCSRNYNHYLGMHDSCYICEKYRKTGEVWYEITCE